jgi:hypothetical protein
VTNSRILSIEEWEAFDRLHPAPTFFAAPTWSLAIAESDSRYGIYPVRHTLKSGETVVVPLLRASGGRLGWRVLVGTPRGAYTSIINENGLLARQPVIDEVIATLTRRHAHDLTLTLWPLGPQPSIRSELSTPFETSVIDLSRGAETAINAMEGSSRRMAGQATRKGVVCAVEHGPAAVETYYDILSQAAQKWGIERPTIPKDLLSALVSRSARDVEIWLARFEGKAIAGGVVLYGAQEAFFWSAATLPDYGVLRANNALAVAIMYSAANRVVKWLNLGASEGLPGVLRFKRSLGAISSPYVSIRWQRPVYRLVQLVRSKFGSARSPSSDRS